MLADDDHPVVLVRVTVNVDSLRSGWEGEVELTPRIQTLVRSGYLQILGHVWTPPEPGPDAPEPPAVVANPTRIRAKRKAGGDGGTTPDPA